MKKLVGLLGIAVGIVALTACGSPYDDEIDQVIQLENKNLDKPSTETDIDTLKRDDTQIWVYNDGEYIKILYVIRDDIETTDSVYRFDDDKNEYIRYSDDESNFFKSDVDDLEPDYTENVDDDDS